MFTLRIGIFKSCIICSITHIVHSCTVIKSRLYNFRHFVTPGALPSAISKPSFLSILSILQTAAGTSQDTRDKLAEDDQSMLIEQQETMKIKGTNQRHMIMQKLMRKSTEVSGLSFSKE